MKSRHVNLHDDFAAVCKIIDHAFQAAMSALANQKVMNILMKTFHCS